jgi:hypothetical protein
MCLYPSFKELLMTDLIGQQLENYRVLHLLGQGGFAQVYLGVTFIWKRGLPLKCYALN